jgi:hypothetical protein
MHGWRHPGFGRSTAIGARKATKSEMLLRILNNMLTPLPHEI